MEQKQLHILVACYPSQGHINPNLRLAKLLARQTRARITFSTAVIAHRRMFPNHQQPTLPGDLFSYIPYSNGFDDGFDPRKHESRDYLFRTKQHGSRTLAAIIDEPALTGHPVTCIIYSFFMSWVADVSLDRNIPSFLHWILFPALRLLPSPTRTIKLPALQPTPVIPPVCSSEAKTGVEKERFFFLRRIEDNEAVSPLFFLEQWKTTNQSSHFWLSFETTSSFELPDDPYGAILHRIGEMFETLDKEIAIRGSKPRVIANTADEMEAPAFESVADKVSMVGIGPLLEDAGEGSLFKLDDEDGYMDWLDTQGERSVVYVSFGSISVLKKEQVEEIW
ncbi:cyanidin 3-O-rutinoside 5-O-glucosyltransferase-like, partial [Phalaenopsis equestris]|uniref:cyanidin 3-O-rutinoside 5-O-glucosyltransferase-like n=1 Tax=Phalaenopsis equestris TaxID=78828 RepID=UPI0009E34D12